MLSATFTSCIMAGHRCTEYQLAILLCTDLSRRKTAPITQALDVIHNVNGVIARAKKVAVHAMSHFSSRHRQEGCMLCRADKAAARDG